MCRSIADGGLRCAAHTRGAYAQARPGTAAWDAAAAEYAATSEGKAVLERRAAHCDSAGNIDEAERTRAALRAGVQRREVAAAVSDQVSDYRANGVPGPTPTPHSDSQVLTDGIWDVLAEHSKYRSSHISLTLESRDGRWTVQDGTIDTTGSQYADPSPVVRLDETQTARINDLVNESFEADHEGSTARLRSGRGRSAGRLRFILYPQR